jgi:hypothetical protein
MVFQTILGIQFERPNSTVKFVRSEIHFGLFRTIGAPRDAGSRLGFEVATHLRNNRSVRRIRSGATCSEHWRVEGVVAEFDDAGGHSPAILNS